VQAAQGQQLLGGDVDVEAVDCGHGEEKDRPDGCEAADCHVKATGEAALRQTAVTRECH